MAKKIINIFLILVLCTQMLPVKQIGAALYSNLFNEEMPHSLDVDDDCAKKIGGKSEFIYYSHPLLLALPIMAETFFIKEHQDLPHNHTLEILVPPPNC
jgi:hypothetical protein